MAQNKSVAERLWAIAIWALVIFFVANVIATIAVVAVNSLGTRWFGAWLPAGFTTHWYISAWDEFQLQDVLIVTFQVVGVVVLFSVHHRALARPTGHETFATRVGGTKGR